MILTTWLTIVSICLLGAMSPGPSLAVVLRHTLHGGHKQGVIAAVFHALGVGIYAFLCISGIAIMITSSPTAFTGLQWGGALYLAWLGFKGLRSKPGNAIDESSPPSTSNAARDGFAVAFLNPKIAVFFIALFSQVVGSETSQFAKLAYATTAMVIDGLWYIVVAWLFSRPGWLGFLQARAVWFDRLFGVILLGLAVRMLLQSI